MLFIQKTKLIFDNFLSDKIKIYEKLQYYVQMEILNFFFTKKVRNKKCFIELLTNKPKQNDKKLM